MLHNELTKFFTDSFKGAAEQQYVEPVVNPGDISDREKHIDKMMLDALKAGYRYDPTTRTYTKIEGGGGGSDATDPETLNTLVDNLEKDLDIGKFMSSVNNENLRVMPAKSPHAAYLKDNWFWVGDEQLPYSKVRDKAAAAKMSVNDYIIANKLEPIDELSLIHI